jgi:flagellar hook-associated protein 2
MALSSPGIGSNLDVNSIVSQLMALERRPITALDKKEAGFQAQLTAYGTLKGALSSFQNALKALATPARFTGNRTGVADTTVLTASAGSGAAAGSYGIQVTALAQAHKLKTGTTFASTSETLGSGTLSIQFGTYSGGIFTANPDKAAATITIPAGQNSLAGVRDAINAANAGVTAGIVNDGSGNLLTIASKDGGVANALRITVTDDDGNNTDNAGLSRLAYDAATGGTSNMAQSQAAQNATVIIDGITVSKSTNIITDAIEGVTLNLLKTNVGSSTALTVSRDTGSIKSAVESFVKSFNDAAKAMKDLSAYNAAAKHGAILQGDSTLRTIQSQLRAVINSALSTAGGGLTTLSDIGVAFQKDGTLALDGTKLQKALDDPNKDISTLFAAVGKPTDSLVSYVGSTSDTKAGSYALNVTQIATQGKAVGAVTLGGSTVITAGSNDTLAVSIDGTAATITLGAGTYTPAQLAAEIQSRINGNGTLSAAGNAVAVSQSGGILTISSRKYGSASSATVSGGNAQADLFGATTDTAGVDVAGTIGGQVATGSGQSLTGSGDAAGLKLTVAGGATGDRGTVNFSLGYAHQLEQLMGRLLDNDGPLAGRTGGINRTIRDIAGQRDVLERRLDMIEKRYRAQFSALDTMIASMTKTSNFLTQQLANLPGAAKQQ